MARGDAELLPAIVHLVNLMIKHNVSPADLDERFVGLLSAEKPKSDHAPFNQQRVTTDQRLLPQTTFIEPSLIRRLR